MDPKQLALEHFEKVIALVAAGWLVMAMANYTSSPKELGLKDELQTKIDNINDYVAKHEPVKPKVPDWEARVKKSLGAEGAPEPQEFPGWVMHRRPNVVYKWKTVVFDQEPVHTPPTDLSLRPERGRITVTWSPSNQNALVTVTKYEVLRKVNDEKYAVVGEVEGETAEFADVNVNPRSRYWYKVRATAELDKEHPVVRKMIGRGVIKELKKELTVMESEESGPVKTPRTTIATVCVCSSCRRSSRSSATWAPSRMVPLSSPALRILRSGASTSSMDSRTTVCVSWLLTAASRNSSVAYLESFCTMRSAF